MMGEHRNFDTGNDAWDITRHPDGSLTIESEAEYGDSYNGWGSARQTLHLLPDQVKALASFLTAEK
jgi:hypothetical protein